MKGEKTLSISAPLENVRKRYIDSLERVADYSLGMSDLLPVLTRESSRTDENARSS